MLRTLPTHPTLRHPITGLPLEAVYVTRSGRIVWPQMGGDGTGEDGDGGGGAEGGGDKPKTFTQAELDRVVADRLARERAKYSDYDDAKAKAAKFDEAEQANKSELEREKEARAAAEKARDEALAASQRTTVRSAVVAEAAKVGAVDPADVVALLAADAVTVDKDGKVTGVEQAVADLKKAKPHLFGEADKPARPSTRLAAGPRGSGREGSTVQSGRDLYAQRNPRKTTNQT